MRQAVEGDRPIDNGSAIVPAVAAEEIQACIGLQHERGAQPIVARAAAGLILPGGGAQDMDDFRVAVVPGSGVAMLNVEQNIGMQGKDIGGIAQAGAQSLDAHGLLAGCTCIKINVTQVRINADVIPLRIAADSDGQVIIAAAAA